MHCLFINAYQESQQETGSKLLINIETLITLFVYKLTDTESIQLTVNLLAEKPEQPLIIVNFANIDYKISSNIPAISAYCIWPIIVSERNVIAGLCSVSRELIKRCNKPDIRKLLGFREASLMACSESSIWTRFCEVDIIDTAKKLIENQFFGSDEGIFYLPRDVARFEYHMSKPVRMHNIYKAAREKNNDKGLKSNIPIEELNLDHVYGEGTSMTLADIILYPCFKILFSKCPKKLLEKDLQLTLAWFKKVEESGLDLFDFDALTCDTKINKIVDPDFVKQSLYTSDPTRYKPEKRIYTKQNDIEESFKAVSPLENDIVNEILPFGHEIRFNWLDIPLEANPNGGSLPEKRAGRKCEQLESLAKAVVKLAGMRRYKIVDFCSGSGHLGILLAILLPNCDIILVENKEHSLARARDRINKLNLVNTVIVQSNLDYFVGSFDIGVSLHACGVATDLVIQNCINNRAHFVSCPCCYGGVKDCYHLTYPRSKQFKKLGLSYKSYLNFAHAADQTHDVDNVKTKQGYVCMDIVDTDRRMYAESCGYEVCLGKLQPETCTNKNNLLVGRCKEKLSYERGGEVLTG